MSRESASIELGRLAGLVEAGRLRPHIPVETSWQEIGKVAKRLLERDFIGKAVLHIG